MVGRKECWNLGNTKGMEGCKEWYANREKVQGRKIVVGVVIVQFVPWPWIYYYFQVYTIACGFVAPTIW